MKFQDFGPWQASKIMPPRCGFVTADFYFKTPARIKKHLVRAPENIKIIEKKPLENKQKSDTRKSVFGLSFRLSILMIFKCSIFVTRPCKC